MYCVRTAGGSLSTVNVNMGHIYDLLLAEFMTNVIKAADGRVLGVGSKSLYLLTNNIQGTKFSCISGIGEYELDIKKVL